MLVLNNLYTHTAASLYQAFKAETARRLAKCLEFHYTTKPGSWLNITEIELSVIMNPCLDSQIPSLAEVLLLQPFFFQTDHPLRIKPHPIPPIGSTEVNKPMEPSGISSQVNLETTAANCIVPDEL